MKRFADAHGRTWTLSITLGSAMRVKDALGIDLLQPEAGDPPLLTRLGTDEMLLGEVLCALMQDQFDAHDLTPEQVRDSFDGETLCAAQSAFYEDMIDFFQQRGRLDRAKATAKQLSLIQAAVAEIAAKVDAIDVDETIRGAMSGNSPETSESTPAT